MVVSTDGKYELLNIGQFIESSGNMGCVCVYVCM